MEILKVSGLNKSYDSGSGAVAAIRNLNFAMGTGCFEAIMGPSGSGKSTLLYLIAGLLAPDSGSIMIEGRELVGLGDRELTLFRRRRIGLIFQDFNLVSTLTVRENIMLPLLLDGTADKWQERVDGLIAALGLNERGGHLPHQLSGGERQRVAIARALAGAPAIVLADEPTGNLDSPAARNFCLLLRRMNAEFGASILLVSHDPMVAATADRVHILRDGCFSSMFEPHGDAASVSEHYIAAMR